MRLIGHLQGEKEARIFGDYLVAHNIGNLIEPDGNQWAVWICSEEQLDAGSKALEGYRQNPDDPRFHLAGQVAASIAEQNRREQAEYEARFRRSDQIWRSSASAPVTVGLMVASIGVTLLMAADFPVMSWLQMGNPSFSGNLAEIRAGQIWRLVTPIFIHFDVLHILFNMMMLRDMGTMVERRLGSGRYSLLVLALAVASNLGQYYYDGPGFGGMSGVLYGLLGFIWIRSQCDPRCGLQLSPTTLPVMMIWFFLCLAGVIPHVANACHAAGLVLGMLMGAWPALRRSI